ncbi:MAG: ferrous iron transport protein B [Anaeroplasmataceae bacterium]|nr:ferrous iron transport protein B [Anaeroplasmataceae bacterium]
MKKHCCLVGNQNSGKTLLFNVLTGLNQKVGNWPGVTVERKDGIIKGTDVSITDLPGIYSLSPYTSEEEVSRKYVVEENPDLIINIIDATSIERALYLTTQLLELHKKVLVVLNMEDILAKKGYQIDTKKLSECLGTTVVSISALQKTGIKELINTIDDCDRLVKTVETKIFSPQIEELISEISNNIDPDIKEKRFAAIKIIERDERYYSKFYHEEFEEKIKVLESKMDMDTEQMIASFRYDYIEQVRDKSVQKKKVESFSQKIDKVLLNKWFAIPIFLVVILLVYLLSVGLVGGATVGIVDMLFNGADVLEFPLPFIDPIEVALPGEGVKGLGPWLAECITNAGGSDWAASLVADGAIAGMGAVLNFVPQIAILFLLISLLETCGYMSRITFLFDRAFKKLGMSGKSLIPFVVGTGCSVPAIMSARTLEDRNEHQMTVTFHLCHVAQNYRLLLVLLPVSLLH